MSLFFSLFPCKSFHTFSLLYLTSFLLNQKKSMYVLTCLTLISVHVISLIFSICVPHVFHIFCWSFTSCPSCLYIYMFCWTFLIFFLSCFHASPNLSWIFLWFSPSSSFSPMFVTRCYPTQFCLLFCYDWVIPSPLTAVRYFTSIKPNNLSLYRTGGLLNQLIEVN